MTIQRKFTLLLLTFVILFTLVLAIQLYIEKQRMMLFMEKERAAKDLNFDKILKLKRASLDNLAYDYTFWDEMVDFIRTKDQKWAKENLEVSLSTYKANAIWVYTLDLSLVYSVDNLQSAELKDIPIPRQAVAGLFSKRKFCHFFLNTESGLLEVRGATIHASSDEERKAPAQGYFFAAVLWGKDHLNELMELTDTRIRIIPRGENNRIHQFELSSGELSFLKTLYGWDSRPLATLEVSGKIEGIRIFGSTSSWLSLLFVCFNLIVIITLSILSIFWIGRPLKSISLALKEEDARHLENVSRAKNELGEVSRLIARFFVQGQVLRDREERLKQIAEDAEEWIWEVDSEGLYTYSNFLVEKLLGYKPEEIVGKRYFYDFFLPKQREELKKAALRGFADKEPFRGFINPCIHKNGGVVYLETNGTPLLDKKRNLLGYRGADRNITERMRSEEALRRSEAQFSNAIEMAHMGPWEYDVAKDQFTFNDHFYAMFRTTADQVGGYTMSSAEYAKLFLYPEDRELVAAEIRRLADPGIADSSRKLEHRIRYFDGETGYITVRFSIVRDGKGRPFRTYGVNQDITERKKTEEALFTGEARYKELVDNMSSGVAVYEVRGDGEKFIFKDFNKAAEKIEGVNKEEVIGKDVLDAFPGVLSFGLLEIFKRVYISGKPEFHPATLYKDSRISSWRENYVYKLPTGEIVAVYDDITLRKKAEEELKEAYQKLKDAQMQLIQTEKMAAVGQLASGVAHEINNPLTGVLNNVQLIKMEAEAKKGKFDFKEFKEMMDIVEESALRCRKITQSLLAFSRSPKGEFNPVDINELVVQVITLVEHEMNLGNIAIKKELQPGLPHIPGDIQLLQQVVFNFISNAKWAIENKSPQAGGKISIKTAYAKQENMVCILVSDTGIGIPEEHLSRIFEPFFTTKPVGEGTGLGLSVAYSIIKEHQGNIQVESTVNQGTTFKICFPLK